MNKISNDFVTIEYETDKQQKIANYYLKLFDTYKEFYIGILNGKEIIHANELINIPNDILEKDELNDFTDECIIKSIFKFSNIENINLYEPSIGDLLYAVTKILELEEIDDDTAKRIYQDMAYNYFLETNDFSYMKKFLFQFENNTEEELCNLCSFTILHHLDDLLKQNLYSIKLSLKEKPYIYENLEDVIKLVFKFHEDLGKNKMEVMRDMYYETMMEENSNNTISTIDEKKFEDLVLEAINYIDPTNKLLEYYLESKKEDRLKIEKIEPGQEDNSCFAYCPETDEYGIYLNTYGTITDVVALMHELGHLYYTFIDRGEKSPNELFDEVPSIYFELKTLEFLKTKGYSENELMLISNSRTYSNIDFLLSVSPILRGLYRNKDNKLEDYDIYDVKHLIDSAQASDPAELQRIGLTREEAEEVINVAVLKQCYRMLGPATNVIRSSMYLVGTYLAEHSIENLKHEDVLEILNKIRSNPYNVAEILKMFGINPSILDINITEMTPKLKKIGTKQDN